MTRNYKIRNMQVSDVNEALELLWEQFNLYCNGKDDLPNYWRNSVYEIEQFLINKVKNKTIIVAELDNQLIGYLGYEEFPFNGEKSVYCPVILHAVLEEYKAEVYPLLYKNASREWVSRNIFNHMWTINYNDKKLTKILFDIGFGSYLIDAVTKTNIELNCNESFIIKRADGNDKKALYDLVEESRKYYSAAPLFLKRSEYKLNDIVDTVNKGNVFIVLDNKKVVGYINISISKSNSFTEMYTRNYGLIDEIGVYIKNDYRGMGLGKSLLATIFDYCRSNNIDGIHVDFETANLEASKFWLKYFNPTLLSMRRTINKNINDK